MGERLGRFEVDVGNPDEGSGAGQLLDRGGTNAAGAPGDQSMAAIETKGMKWRIEVG